MPEDDDITELRAALAEHKKMIEHVHAQAMATELLLTGLLYQLNRTEAAKLVEAAFDFASSVAIANSDKTRAFQATESVRIIEEIQSNVFQRHRRN